MSTERRKAFRSKVQFQVGITIALSGIAAILFMMIGKALDIHVSKVFYPLLAFPLNLVIITRLYPRKLRIPFGKVTAEEFARGIGLYTPRGLGRNIALGVVLAACTLSGMLVGSLLTGRYEFDVGNVTVEQVAFSTVPGVWEEVYFRGILMMALLFAIKDARKAMVLQSVIFGLMHFRGVGLWDLADVLSVVLIGLAMTYAAYKTNVLLPVIVFHFLHDAFLFLVQVPDAAYNGVYENLAFYAGLWAMLGVGCIVTKFASERLGIRQPEELYDLDKAPATDRRDTPSQHYPSQTPEPS